MAELEEVLRAGRRWLPRYADLRYMRGHFADSSSATAVRGVAAEADGPLHGRGRRLLGPRPDDNVRDTPIAEIIAQRRLPRGARAVLPQGVRRLRQQLRLNLRWRPQTTCDDLLWRLGARQLARRRVTACMRSSEPLFDALAPTTTSTSRCRTGRAYDDLAWEHAAPRCPAPPGRRWSTSAAASGAGPSGLLDLGYAVIGIEPSPGMAEPAAERLAAGASEFTLLAAAVEDVELRAARSDAVLAMGSLQYTDGPGPPVAALAGWLRPAGSWPSWSTPAGAGAGAARVPAG